MCVPAAAGRFSSLFELAPGSHWPSLTTAEQATVRNLPGNRGTKEATEGAGKVGIMDDRNGRKPNKPEWLLSDSEVRIADALETVVHEMIEALTAAHVFTTTSRRALRLVPSDHVLCDRGLTRATEQLARATEAVRLMRQLSEQLRDRFSSASDIEGPVRASPPVATWENRTKPANLAANLRMTTMSEQPRAMQPGRALSPSSNAKQDTSRNLLASAGVAVLARACAAPDGFGGE